MHAGANGGNSVCNNKRGLQFLLMRRVGFVIILLIFFLVELTYE